MAKIINSVVSKHLPPSGQSGAGKSGAGVSIMLNADALVSILVVNPDSIQEWNDNVWGNRYLEVNRRADLLSEVKRAAQMNVSVNISGSQWLTKMEPHEWTFPQADKDYSLVNDVTGKSHTLRLLSDGSLSVSPECRLLGRIVLVPMQPVVRFAVVDIADGESLTGAMVQIIDSDGAVVEEWESSSEPHAVEGLNTDVEYTLLESYVPDSYTLAPEITFSLNEDYTPSSSGNVTRDGVILIENALTHVEIDVVNIADGESLEGSHIQIIDQDGLVVEEWDSVGEPHRVEGLRVGVEYTLREVLATEGYALASDTTFNIDEQGVVTYSGSTSETEDGDVLLLVENTLTHIEFDVVNIADGESLEGSHIQIIDDEGLVVEEWDSVGEPYRADGLRTGVEYTLHCEEPAEGFSGSPDTTFTIDETGHVGYTGSVLEDGVLLIELIPVSDYGIVCRDQQTGVELACPAVSLEGPLSGEMPLPANVFYLSLPDGDYTISILSQPNGYPSFNQKDYFFTLQGGAIVNHEDLDVEDSESGRQVLIIPFTKSPV